MAEMILNPPKPGINPPGMEPPTTGDAGATWRTGLSDEGLRGHASLQRYKTLDEFAKGHLELEKKVGERPLAYPAQDAPPEQWQAFWKQHPDYPAAETDYPAMEGVPQGLEMDAEMLNTFKKGAHARGMTKAQLKYVQDFYTAELVTKPWQASQQSLERDAQTTMRDMTQRYGSDAAQTMVATAREYIRRTFGDNSAFLGTLISRDGEARPLGNSMEFIQMAYENGLARGYNQYVQGDGSGGLLSLQQAQGQLQEIEQRLLRKEITAQEYNAQVVRLQPLITASRQAQERSNAMVGNRL